MIATAIDPRPVVLEGRLVRLEPLSNEHLDGLSAVGLDPELWKFVPIRIVTRDEMAQRIQEMLAAAATLTELPFVTVERATDTIVGCTRFMNIDAQNGHVEIGGTWVANPWQRTGVNTEAKYLMLRHAFETWKCLRVELKTDALNTKSRTAILRLGAKEEGILRRHTATWDGRHRDTVYYSILSEEWPAVKARLESMMAGA